MSISQSGRESVDGDRPGGRRAAADDPADGLRARTRRRLIGAAALLIGSVVVLPMLLDSTPKQVPEDVAITVVTPPVETRPEVRPQPVAEPKVAEPVAPVTEPVPAAAEPAPVAAPPQPAAKAEARSTEKTEAKPPAEAKTPSSRATQPPPAAGRISVQVAALSTPAAAEELQVRLITEGFTTAYVVPVTTVSGVVHRVRVGPFAGRDEAQRAVERLKAAGYRPTIVGG